VLDVLLIWKHDWTADNIEVALNDRGWRVTRTLESELDSGTDWAAYEVVALGFEAGDALPETLIESLQAGDVGMVVHRGARTPLPGLGTDSWYSEAACGIDPVDHFITEPFPRGILDLGYRYKTSLAGVPLDSRVLLSCSGPTVVAHPTLRLVATAYYGHDAGMPWSADGELLDLRSYAWAAGYGEQ